jgi:hypothetical protein
MKLFTRDYFLLTKEQNTLSPKYLKTLRKLGATTQQIALTSFLHSNKYWIINSTNKTNFTIEYMCGNTYQATGYLDYIKRIRMEKEDFKSARKSYFKRYFAVVKKLRERRKKHRANRLNELKLKLESLL